MENIQERLINAIHGNLYQLKLLMLFLWRGVCHEYSFRLNTEVKQANKFDDVIFEYIENDKKVYRLLQAKHKIHESKTITAHNLLTENNGNYNLIKYFISYQCSKGQGIFKDGSIRDIIIWTNINWNFDDLKSTGITVEKIEASDDILDVQYSRKQPRRYRFNHSVVPLMKRELERHSKVGVLKRKIECSDNEIKDFLNHLVFAVDQPNEVELDEILKQEMSKELDFDFITMENVYNMFFMRMLDWFKGKEGGRFLSFREGKEFFGNIKKELPLWFNIRYPIKSFTGRLKELNDLHTLLQTEDSDKVVQPVCINGLGGIGKSEIVRKYASLYSKNYDDRIVWINAESYETLVESFRRLACDKLRITTKNADGKEKAVKSLVEDVYKFFFQRKSLFIFDNAERYKSQSDFDNGVDKFLPVLPPNYNRLYVIITSRNQKWPKNVRVLQLDFFTESEAVEFVERCLNIGSDTQNENVKELVGQLNCFPLALQQAVAYIKMYNEKLKLVGSTFEISSYFEKYVEKTKELLNFEFPEDSESDYTKTVFTTWNVTLDMIKNGENGDDALEILRIVSYFAPERIPIDMLSKLISDEEKLASAIEILKQYSMINLVFPVLHVHRMVQRVTRMYVEDQKLEEVILAKALSLFSEDSIDSTNVNHALYVWNYTNKYEGLIIEFFPLSSWISRHLTDSARYEEAYSFGVKLLQVLQDMPKSPDIILGVAGILNNTGGALLGQGKYDFALGLFLQAFGIQSRILGASHQVSLITKQNIAMALAEQGKYDDALICCQDILNAYKDTLGNNHHETLLMKKSIGAVLCRKGQYKESLKVFQELYDEMTMLGANDVEIRKIKNTIAMVRASLGSYDATLGICEEICAESTLGKPLSILAQYLNIGAMLLDQDKYSDALNAYQKGLSLCKDVLAQDHPEILRTRYGIAEVLRFQGKYEEALEICEDVCNRQINTLGSAHPDTLRTQFCKAAIFMDQMKNSDALQLFHEVLKKQKDLLGNNHPSTHRTGSCIAGIYVRQREYNRALYLYQGILNSRKESLGEDHIHTLQIKNDIGHLLFAKGEIDRALEIFQEVLNTLVTSFPESPKLFATKYNMALVYARQGKHEDALKIFREVLDFRETTFGKEHREVAEAKCSIAAVLLVTEDKYDEALKMLREVLVVFDKIYGSQHPRTLNVRHIIESAKANKSSSAEGRFFIMGESDSVNRFAAETYGESLKCAGEYRQMEQNKSGEANSRRPQIVESVETPNNANPSTSLKKESINAKDSNGRTKLHFAIYNGNISTVNTLLKNGADVTQVTDKGNTPLHTAVSKGYKEIVETLLQHVNRDELCEFINTRTIVNGTTSLHVAAKNGYLEIVKCLLKHGANWNVRNKKNEAPINVSNDQNVVKLLQFVEELFIDAESGNVQIISKLSSISPDDLMAVMGARNDRGNTLLQVATKNKHRKIARKLVKMLQKSDKN